MIPFPHYKERLLSNYSTFGIGGPARFFATATTCDQLQKMLQWAYAHKVRFFILGKGSNTLFDDRGFDGLVILNRIDYLKQQDNRFIVGSGYSFARLGGITARRGLSGLEFAAGIPATVGGAVAMNAGANGQETADHLLEVSFIAQDGSLCRFSKIELFFGYRTSCFQQLQGAIVEATFVLTPLENASAKQKKILNYRLMTQPYKDKTAGCAFRNPQGESAGRLIEQCGLKGMQVGNAAISTMHGNFIVNAGGARCADVLNLMKTIQQAVLQETGIELKPEIHYVPYA